MTGQEDDQAPIDIRGDLYVYEVIAERITRRINAGEFPPGAMLPSELALAEWYGVSRASVRRARELMEEQGIVHARPHKGTFVTERPADPC
jgi:DNA-binding GntR family transcriptional regulator